MKKLLMIFAMAAMANGVQAAKVKKAAAFQYPVATYTEWHDMQVNSVNRYNAHTTYFAYENREKALGGEMQKSDNFVSLHGQWKFKWVENADQRPTDFYVEGLDDSAWGTMPVPGIWEMNGYGDPLYVNSGFAWRGHFKNNPPEAPTKDNHVGSYRKEISIPADWDGKQVIAHFGSVTSNIYLYVNGKFVGYSEDSKVAAEFDITPYVHTGKNLIAFQVFRWCDGSYCEDQDFWRLSGVARDSYLYCRDAKTQLTDLRITPDLENNYEDGILTIHSYVKGAPKIEFSLLNHNGIEVIKSTADFKKQSEGDVKFTLRNVKNGQQRHLIYIRSWQR